MNELHQIRTSIRLAHYANEHERLDQLVAAQPVSALQRKNMQMKAVDMINRIRSSDETGLMEQFLGEYGLSTHEGLCLMTLAESLLRVPDQATVTALIEDKIGGGIWSEHVGRSDSALVNFSTRALVLTRSVLNVPQNKELSGGIRAAVKRLGEPVIRRAVRQAMVELGKQFVLGETVDEALSRGMNLHKQGYRYSYDMLGEAALTAEDAQGYLKAYTRALEKLASVSTFDECRTNPGISVKLSALHPRYEFMSRERVMQELVPRVLDLAKLAAGANMGFNIDAEEANRLDLSLDVIEAVLSDGELAGWDGFGVVVQGYGLRCTGVLDWLHALSVKLDRRIMVRLVKGAYWDTEIKEAQVLGLEGFPVFTDKSATDVAYICCSRQLLGMKDRIYSQFATHNAHTVAAILELADELDVAASEYEFQRLHGMGEALHDVVRKEYGTQCRIYAPVGSHNQLLAYLVRRLLENGANSSFVNQLSDLDVSAETIATDPFTTTLENRKAADSSLILMPGKLYGNERENSRGMDITDITHMQSYEQARSPFTSTLWNVASLVADDRLDTLSLGEAVEIRNPSRVTQLVGTVRFADEQLVESALQLAKPWHDSTSGHRRDVLNKASYMLEDAYGELFALLSREAGKTALDAIAELREAVDFMRYYGHQATMVEAAPCGVFACISPWNFPLAIFLGQVSAALAAGNAVVCKPAESTVIVAWRAVQILYEAGVPRHALQLLPGLGADVGQAMTSDKRIHGVCFTGSTGVARKISQSIARNLSPSAPLIAETGGLNAMIIDSTALPEQAIKDVVASAFQSAGQRCSALRILCLQEDIAAEFVHMLYGAMDELKVGDSWQFDTDVGPIINQSAQAKIQAYIDDACTQGRVSKQCVVDDAVLNQGFYIPPTVISIEHFNDVTMEVFGPVLHVLSYPSSQLEGLLDSINNSGYGLTFGLHTRIESRADDIVKKLYVGNIYVNRNQIGAVVGTQPFGGEGLSGTGPKAGGSMYLPGFCKTPGDRIAEVADGKPVDIAQLQRVVDRQSTIVDPLSVQSLPGPTGESNTLRVHARGLVLCLGPGRSRACQQALEAKAVGCAAVAIADGNENDTLDDAVGFVEGTLTPSQLEAFSGVSAVVYEGPDAQLRAYRIALADRDGPLTPLICLLGDIRARCVHERHVCVDTTAAGGNANLLAAS